MKQILTLSIIILILLSGCGSKKLPPQPTHTNFNRIISLAPSITETLFALGLGDKVVGVTRFCTYPEEVKKLPKLGGLTDINYEAIVLLKPDVVILSDENAEAKKKLSKIGIKVFAVKVQDWDDITESFLIIGRELGVEDKAEALKYDFDAKVKTVQELVKNLDKPRVLVSIDRDFQSKKVEKAWIAGNEGLYNKMIEIAGGKNAYEGITKGSPILSSEGIIRLNPDVIIDTIANFEELGYDEKIAKSAWNSLPQVSAVKNKRVYLFTQEYVARPGPGIVRLLPYFVKAIHPELADKIKK